MRYTRTCGLFSGSDIVRNLAHQVRILRLLFVINDHGLNICQHVLSLTERLVLLRALLNLLHRVSGTPMLLLLSLIEIVGIVFFIFY